MSTRHAPKWVWLPRTYSKLPLTNWQTPPYIFQCRQRSIFSQNFSFFSFNFPSKKKSVLLSAFPEIFESDCLSSTMKKSGLFAAFVAAASATAISVSSSPFCSNFNCNSNFQFSGEVKSLNSILGPFLLLVTLDENWVSLLF